MAAVVAVSCGWPEFAFDPPPGDGEEGGAGGTGEPSGGTAGASGGSDTGGGVSGSGGASGTGGMGGSGHTDTCENGRQDGDETGVDCGGGACPPCPFGGFCSQPSDCEDDSTCTSRGVCELLSCFDGTANGAETDTDCGGADCTQRCPVGDECVAGLDCETGLCTPEGRCTPPGCMPALCTATCPCENGFDCAHHDECASGNCDAGTCAEGARVLSRNDAPGAGLVPSIAILQTFVVRNDGPSALPLGDLMLRYYFTSDGLGAPASVCVASRAVPSDACNGVETQAFGLSPATSFADAFVELDFPEGAELGAGERTGETPIRVDAPNEASYNQSNDYSFAESSSLRVNTTITLYRNGVLVFGREP